MSKLDLKRRGFAGAGRRWALVLAAGRGSRLGHLTRDGRGTSIPKQFCSVGGGETLLQETLRRAETLVPRERVLTVVAAGHRDWWRDDVSALPPGNVIEQPLDRGTAAGILLPLLVLERRDPHARVVVLPSDHFVGDEPVLAAAARAAFDGLEREPGSLILLGVAPDEADPELGWIVPDAPSGGAPARVERFVEKPPRETAERLLAGGALWNSFIFAARVETLLGMYRRTLPRLIEALDRAVAWEACLPGSRFAVERAYDGLESADFSRELLQRNVAALRVLRVPACGWSDLGTPERLVRCTARLSPALAALPRIVSPRPVLAVAAMG